MTDPVPSGFQALRLRPNPYVDACGPLFGRREGHRLVLGLRVERRHCNPAGTCHGGMLTTLADMLLVLGASAQTGDRRYMLTVSLNCDFVGPAPQGSWIEGRLDVLRATRSLVFCQGLLSVDGAPILRSSGIAKPSGEPDPAIDLDSLLGQAAA
jgi:uncharacterized protein (TIGR00369 family)